jgi:hypothetical protein
LIGALALAAALTATIGGALARLMDALGATEIAKALSIGRASVYRALAAAERHV